MEIDDKVLNEAISIFGIEGQTEKMVEEAAELIHAIQKFKSTGDAIGNFFNLVDEIADVSIMIRQMQLIYDVNNCVQDRIDTKMKKLKAYIVQERFVKEK